MSIIQMTVNGKSVSADVEDRTLLVHLLRENLNLTGTHVGCDTSQCGACIVHIDGRAVKSCTVLVGQVQGANVTTIEGISRGDELILECEEVRIFAAKREGGGIRAVPVPPEIRALCE